MNADSTGDWIVVAVGPREKYLAGLLSALEEYSGRIVFVNNSENYSRFDGVHHVEDFGDTNIYRWWNKGIDYADWNGASHVAVLNDDIECDNSFVKDLFRQLKSGSNAIVDCLNTGNNGGAAWAMDLSYGMRADERFRWWYGDTELFERASAMGKFKKISPKGKFSHLEPNELMFSSQRLQDTAREDANIFNTARRVRSLEDAYKPFAHGFGSGGGDKGTAHDYIKTYARHLTRRWNVDFLEIGVFRGDSLMMWNEYFVDSRVFGVDVDLGNVSYPNLGNAVLCDATDPSMFIEVFGDAEFDYVIDDGSHVLEHQIAAFDHLFQRIKPGGKYFVEDILGDEPLSKLVDHVSKRGFKHQVVDTRRPDTTYNDLILIVFKEWR